MNEKNWIFDMYTNEKITLNFTLHVILLLVSQINKFHVSYSNYA
jgi:hypothetical protein